MVDGADEGSHFTEMYMRKNTRAKKMLLIFNRNGS